MFSLSKHWISESLVIAEVSAGFQILLVGTKSDLKNSDQRDMPGDADISKAEGDQLAKEIKATCYMETSSKTGDGIKEVFDAEKDIQFPFDRLETEIDSDDAKLDTLLLYLPNFPSSWNRTDR